MKSAGNRGIVHGRLQVLHVHVFFAAPLGARHMAQPCADQHQSGVAVRECPHHPRPSADLTVQPLDHVVGTDAGPVFTGKIAVGQRLLYAIYCTLSKVPLAPAIKRKKHLPKQMLFLAGAQGLEP